MENILAIFKSYLSSSEFILFLALGAFCLLGIALNLFIYFFVDKFNIKKATDIITFTVLSLNTLISVYLSKFSETLFLFKDNICFNQENFQTLFLLNLFLFMFAFISSRLLKKARYKTAVVNSYLLNIALFSGFITVLNNSIISFICLDIVFFSIYKFGCEMKIKKQKVYNPNYLLIGILASILFVLFYVLNIFTQDLIQKGIVQVCLAVAFLLKIGIFPVFNYLQSKNSNTNLPFSALSVLLLPCLGIIYITKFAPLIGLSDETFQITLMVFLLTCAFCNAIYVFKTSNLIKLYANCAYFLFTLSIINTMVSPLDSVSLKFALYTAFYSLAMVSLFYILKLNAKTYALNMPLIKGTYKNNPVFALLFSITTLLLTGVIPAAISINATKILKNIYLFDKIEIISVFTLILSYFVLLFGILRVIQNVYYPKTTGLELLMTKRTTLNYVVLIAIILLMNLFL